MQVGDTVLAIDGVALQVRGPDTIKDPRERDRERKKESERGEKEK